jgi:hypothetical protein
MAWRTKGPTGTAETTAGSLVELASIARSSLFTSPESRTFGLLVIATWSCRPDRTKSVSGNNEASMSSLSTAALTGFSELGRSGSTN